jgi:hypothetical protein
VEEVAQLLLMLAHGSIMGVVPDVPASYRAKLAGRGCIRNGKSSLWSHRARSRSKWTVNNVVAAGQAEISPSQ